MKRLDDSTLRILYRGRLSSCNYDCTYCPFAKRRDTAATLRRDADDLHRFVAWAVQATEPLAILFTPWGEGLVRKHYVEALIELSHAPHVQRVAIQTNLSSNLRWLSRANRESLALWCTYHPTQIRRETFLRRIGLLRAEGVRFSVGIVGAREHFNEIAAVRAAMRPDEYMWINALSPRPEGYYSAAEFDYLTSIDPHFPINAAPPPSRGAECRAGQSSISVDGDGNAKPCHFLELDLGNLYDGTFNQRRRATRCPNERCSCFIGYIQRTDLSSNAPFAQGAIERVAAW